MATVILEFAPDYVGSHPKEERQNEKPPEWVVSRFASPADAAPAASSIEPASITAAVPLRFTAAARKIGTAYRLFSPILREPVQAEQEKEKSKTESECTLFCFWVSSTKMQLAKTFISL